MRFIFSLFMLGCGYYTLTYGLYIWKKDKNRLGGAGTIAFAVIGTLAPIFVLYYRS